MFHDSSDLRPRFTFGKTEIVRLYLQVMEKWGPTGRTQNRATVVIALQV